MKSTKHLLAFLAASIGLFAFSQTPSEEYERIKTMFPDQEFVYTQYYFLIDIRLKGDDVEITYETNEEGICMDDNYTSYIENSIYASAFREVESIDAYTLVPNDKKYAKEKVEEFSEHTIIEGNVFHDDSKKITYSYPKMQRGAKTHKNVLFNVLEPHLMPSFYANVYRPILDGKFELRVENGIEIETIEKNMDLLSITKTETKQGSQTIYTWQFDRFNGFNFESQAPSLIYFAPHILVRIKNVIGKAETKRISNDLNDLHAWYCQFINQNNSDSVEVLQMLVNDIVSPEDSDSKAASKIYNWVQKNITYIAVEDGYNGFKPQFATSVCAARYGDCKGMSNLLHNMLKLRGIESHLTWVGTRDIPYSYEEVPTTSVDNHMIVSYVENGKNYFLDPTHSNLAFKEPSPFIQGKQVMINQDCESFILDMVPVTEAEKNQLYDSILVRMDGKDLIGEGYATLTGYLRMDFLSRMQQADYDYLKDYCRAYFQKGSNRFLIDSVWMENSENSNLPLHINYHFSIKEFNLELDGERFIDLNIDAIETPTKVKETRKLPLEINYKLKSTSVVRLDLNKLTLSDELPKNETLGSNELKYSVQYQQNNQIITRKGEMEINTILLAPDQFDSWNQAVSNIQKSKRKRITLNLNQ